VSAGPYQDYHYHSYKLFLLLDIGVQLRRYELVKSPTVSYSLAEKRGNDQYTDRMWRELEMRAVKLKHY